MINDIKYFTQSEFDQKNSPGSGKNMSISFVVRLDKLRQLCGFPFILTSSYRSPEYNTSIGGSKNSYHTKGRAVDILVKNEKQVATIIAYAHGCGLHGIGISLPKDGKPGFIHVDDRPYEKKAIWSY